MAVRVEYLVRETGTNLWRNISLTIAAVLTVGYTWIEQKRKARKASK